MDNVTHSLFGLAIAEAAPPPAGLSRRAWITAAVVAANLPDIDLAYTWITPGPLGYLLHHRGYTHTLAGLAGFVAAIVLGWWLWPAARALPAAARTGLLLLIAVNLGGHLVLDGFNSYGVHPFFPFNHRWYYGDAVFIFEPWLWVLLGATVAWHAGRAGAALAAGIALLLGIVVFAEVIPGVAAVAMALCAIALLAATRRWPRRGRATAALVLTSGFMIGMSGVSGMVRARAIDAAGQTDVVDVVRTPDPGMPICWSILVLSRTGPGEVLRTRVGTLSLAPAWFPAAGCASNRLEAGARPPGDDPPSVAWRKDLREPLDRLRALAREDCWARAWLEFGRAPVTGQETIRDLRFESDVRGNFSAIRLGEPGRGCPPNLPAWRPPRLDLLDPAR